MGKNNMYKCECCGGVMEFDVKTQTLKCTHCDNNIEITNDMDKIRENELTIDIRRKIKVEEKSTSTMVCSGCGANIEIESNDTGTKCPYCGSSYVLAEKQVETLTPDGIISFKIDKNQVGINFRNWINKRHFAPNELKRLYQQGKFQGIYIPYWTFDANAECYYRAEGGKDRKVTYTDEEGNEKTKTETDWYSVSGQVGRFFDDIQICASLRYKKGFFKGIEPFKFNELASYSPEYTSGYLSENYSVALEEAHGEAVSTMNRTLTSMAEDDVKRTYDRVRSVNINPRFFNETYKYLLVPIYSTSYSYKNKNYTVLINGQTGKVDGEYPKSGVKILFLILAIIAIIGFLCYIATH